MQLRLSTTCLERQTPSTTSEEDPAPHASTQEHLLGSLVLQADE